MASVGSQTRMTLKKHSFRVAVLLVGLNVLFISFSISSPSLFLAGGGGFHSED
jgi:hypothetical protein